MADMREKYEKSLETLKETVLTLAKEAYEAIEKSIDVLSTDNIQQARELIAHDKEINAIETDVNDQVVSLITKQQPIATDLRVIMASIKIAAELERIADNAGAIAKIRIRVRFEDEYVIARLETMGKLSMLMLADLYTAYENKDISLTREIIERDDDIDDLYKEIVNTTYLIDNDPFVAGQAQLAGRHLERIGDHITNIAENVYYFITGEQYDKFEK
ncbi:phosphate signaling complex protein PhoU [Macrococcus carouselicus]|uniref:Phosphate-specific transport system accessory protein PhoU n=1 Tax=Macrococcus carouselicus TaxID=69969 RepID=A0A9Q8CP84_9STAP|nr:phosphate signaling complex protein PhoU [Macrococcus carouselicus]TDM04738.1 phosphate signaling complex protein PhoU [Macrococcus carouselicus]